MKIEITDEMVEKAAREQWFAEGGAPNYDLWDEAIDDAIDEYDGELPQWIVARKQQMRAALEAVAPLIANAVLERARELAKPHGPRPCDTDTFLKALYRACESGDKHPIIASNRIWLWVDGYYSEAIDGLDITTPTVKLET